MNRRELLKLIAIATGLPLIGADVLTAAENAAKPAGATHVFTPEEIRFLDEVAETIIPRTSTPGAKDAEVVLETESRAEALALIQKHARQKKAKLVAHCGGLPVLFSEEEMTA